MAGERDFEFDIREACPNRVRYLREAVDMLTHNYPDVDVVEKGVELGPCVYRTVFRSMVKEDFKAAALAVSRINEFVRNIVASLETYGWRAFEKESYIDGGYVYVDVTWVRRIRLPNKRYASLMDIYELSLPYIEGEYRRGAVFFGSLRGEAVAQ
jgi:hypothetical protein